MANSSGTVVWGFMRISKQAGSFGSKKVNAGDIQEKVRDKLKETVNNCERQRNIREERESRKIIPDSDRSFCRHHQIGNNPRALHFLFLQAQQAQLRAGCYFTALSLIICFASTHCQLLWIDSESRLTS